MDRATKYWKDNYRNLCRYEIKRDRVYAKVIELCQECKDDLRDVDPDSVMALLNEVD